MSTYPRELTATELAAMIAGTSFIYVPVNNRQRVGLLVVYGNGCTAGEVALKSAHLSDFSGAWEEQCTAPVPATTPGANGSVATGAAQIVGAFVRPELKTALVGGTIDKIIIYTS